MQKEKLLAAVKRTLSYPTQDSVSGGWTALMSERERERDFKTTKCRHWSCHNSTVQIVQTLELMVIATAALLMSTLTNGHNPEDGETKLRQKQNIFQYPIHSIVILHVFSYTRFKFIFHRSSKDSWLRGRDTFSARSAMMLFSSTSKQHAGKKSQSGLKGDKQLETCNMIRMRWNKRYSIYYLTLNRINYKLQRHIKMLSS